MLTCLWLVLQSEVVVVAELIEHRLLVGCGVLEQGYAVWPVSHPPELTAEVAAMLAAFVFVEQEAVLLQLIGELLLLVICCILAHCNIRAASISETA